MLADELFQLADELSVASDRELGLGPLLEKGESELRQAGDLRLGERFVRELRERLASPLRQRLAEQPSAPRRVARAGLVDQAAHTGEVELHPTDLDSVAGRVGLDRLRAEDFAQLRDE